jgi:hypothetical protein
MRSENFRFIKFDTRKLLVMASPILTLAWLPGPIEAAAPDVIIQFPDKTANLTGVACGQTCHAVGIGLLPELVVVADIGANKVTFRSPTPRVSNC